ncbi:MAG: helix-turn-helix transcriptional regulator [Clostridia bacterium]|nr:helix-turn-helix transcriptional regulator [Clostridia bacterium]
MERMYAVLSVSEKVKKLLPLYTVTLGFNHNQQAMYRPHGTYFHHILCINEGEGYFNFNGEKAVLKKGSVVFLHKNFPVDYAPAGGEFKTSWVTFDGVGAEGLFEYFDVGDYAIISSESMIDKVRELCNLYNRKISTDIIFQKTYSLVIDYFMRLKNQNEPLVLDRAKAFIEQNYHRDISVDDIAKSVGISQSLLFKLFRQEEKTTPVEHLRDVRISKASILLVEDKLKIYEVASLCGFSDVAYFCKVFKAQTGETPNSYRNKQI